MLKDCIPASTSNAPMIPNRRVNYEFGMVLGVNDFRQEQAHFEWKTLLSNRLLHGYGTVSGLGVSAEGVLNPDGVQIRVGAGYAISPQGRWIWLENDLCARLDEWVRSHSSELSPPLSPGLQTVYVTLCYDECPTELVPVAGKACASEQDTRVASRVGEAYYVSFDWIKPEQHAEDSMRAFGDLLARVRIVAQFSPPTTDDRQALYDAILHLADAPGMPPASSPPGPALFALEEDTACEVIRQALALWTTHVHPALLPLRFGPFRESQPDCLLLACIQFEMNAAGEVIFNLEPDGTLTAGDIETLDCDRPIIVPDRLKQELFCLTSQGEGTAAGMLGMQSFAGPQGLTPAAEPSVSTSLVGPAATPGAAAVPSGGEVAFTGVTLRPGQTVFSPILDSGLGAAGPILLSVSSPTASHFRASSPTNTSVALALTVYETEVLGRFRIGVTNLSQSNITDFTIRWTALRS